MLDRLRKSYSTNKKELDEIKLYFEKCAYEIDKRNLYMLRRVGMYTSVVFISMLLIAFLIVHEFKMNTM